MCAAVARSYPCRRIKISRDGDTTSTAWRKPKREYLVKIHSSSVSSSANILLPSATWGATWGHNSNFVRSVPFHPTAPLFASGSNDNITSAHIVTRYWFFARFKRCNRHTQCKLGCCFVESRKLPFLQKLHFLILRCKALSPQPPTCSAGFSPSYIFVLKAMAQPSRTELSSALLLVRAPVVPLLSTLPSPYLLISQQAIFVRSISVHGEI
jgi:hypothetical protein